MIMDPTTMEFIISLSGAIILMLLGAIAFFFRQLYNIVMELKDIVGDLKSIVGTQRSELSSLKEANDDKHKVIDLRLNAHADRLDKYGNRITVLETKKQ